uniref:aldehyde dehydrogenase (NAD(+)) n=1 Tax=Strombidium rassoulzadegani TaxID=1082188 RepID=A0A7S3CRF4_9SPIT|mmetsp:Transcript_4842/g.8306  ORF Transcript_4842/g.8306 Transcript_4842/m.8306 type:complete len:350 (+) Transcript_4842:425-1474(+)
MNGPYSAYTIKHPVGVCGQIIPWNYPTLMAVFKLAPVLATGCTSVLKPAENTPLSALKLAQIMMECGLPDGVVNVVPGYGHDAGSALVNHPLVDKIAFTGSEFVGKKIMRDAAETMKRVTLELGGKSPNIIMDDANLEQAIIETHNGCFVNSGQFCMASTRVYVHDDIYDMFVEGSIAMAKSRKVGGPYEDKVQNGPVVSQVQLDRVLKYIDIGKKEGATVACGGVRIDREGYFIEPTIFINVTDDMTIAKEEIFGPVMCILRFKFLNEVLKRANASSYGLAGGAMTTGLQNAQKITKGLQSGIVFVNCWGAMQPTTPFGGMKQSGYGRELGGDSLHEYLETKTIITKI